MKRGRKRVYFLQCSPEDRTIQRLLKKIQSPHKLFLKTKIFLASNFRFVIYEIGSFSGKRALLLFRRDGLYGSVKGVKSVGTFACVGRKDGTGCTGRDGFASGRSVLGHSRLFRASGFLADGARDARSVRALVPHASGGRTGSVACCAFPDGNTRGRVPVESATCGLRRNAVDDQGKLEFQSCIPGQRP